MIRFFDILFSALGLLLGWPVLAVIALIGLWDTGSPLFRQQRAIAGGGAHAFDFQAQYRTLLEGGGQGVQSLLCRAIQFVATGSELHLAEVDVATTDQAGDELERRLGRPHCARNSRNARRRRVDRRVCADRRRAQPS